MPSSDLSPARRFALAFGGTLLLALLALGTALWVTDPLGAGHGNAICPAGPKTPVSRYTKFILPATQAPEAVFIGTSRVHYGFDSAAMQAATGTTRVANLGIDGALAGEMVALGDETMAEVQRPVIVVAADFSLVHQPTGGTVPSAGELPGAGPLAALRAEWFGDFALRALPAAVADCSPKMHADGTPIRATNGFALGAAHAVTDPVELTRRFAEVDTQALMDQRLGQLQQAIARWKAGGARVVLLAAPYQADLLALYDSAGALPQFEEFNRRLGRIAAEEGVAFVDLHRPDSVELAPCPEGGTACHYFDLTHYRPEVALAMAPAIRAATGD